MERKSLENEMWREYDFGGRVYRIDEPRWLYVGETTHRIVDKQYIVHCVPSVGFKGCVLRWKNKDNDKPVNF